VVCSDSYWLFQLVVVGTCFRRANSSGDIHRPHGPQWSTGAKQEWRASAHMAEQSRTATPGQVWQRARLALCVYITQEDTHRFDTGCLYGLKYCYVNTRSTGRTSIRPRKSMIVVT